MTAPAPWLDELRAAPIPELAGLLGITLRRGGALAPCPWCGLGSAREPRCRVFGTRKGARVKCHGCGAGGTSVDLAARIVLGRPPAKGTGDLSTGGPLWAWWTGGLAQRPELRPVARPPLPEPEPGPTIPPAELSALWGEARPLAQALAGEDGPALRRWLDSKGMDADRLANVPRLAELLRILPPAADLDWPAWWPYNRPDRRGRGEAPAGAEVDVFRLAVLARTATGEPRAIQARTLLTPDELSARGLAPKDRLRWSAGGAGSCSGLLFLDPAALAVIADEAGGVRAECKGWLVVEGLSDTLRALTLCREPGRVQALAIAGAASGGFPAVAELAKLTPGRPVFAAIDADRTGDRYAAELAALVPDVFRVPFAGGEDLCDAFRGQGAAELADRLELALSFPVQGDEGAEPEPSEPEPSEPGEPWPSPDLPTMADAYTPADLDEDWGKPILTLAELPGWMAPGDTRIVGSHGWGRDVDQLIGGLRPPFFLAVGAAGAGAGKTAWIHQIADGLALRSAALAAMGPGPEPLTPVLFLSEMGRDSLTWRSVGRYIGTPPSYLRAGRAAVELYGASPAELARALPLARAALADGPLADARRWIRLPARARTLTDSGARALAAGGRTLTRYLSGMLRRWADEVSAEHGRPCWPVVVVDPVQRFLSAELSEVEGLSEAAEAWLALSEDLPAIVLASSDTNKPAASGKEQAGRVGSQPWAVATFRGSQKLMHAASAAFCLYPIPAPRPEEGDLPRKGRTRKDRGPAQLLDRCGRPVVGLAVAKARWSALHRGTPIGLAWTPALVGRFDPVDVREALRDAAERQGLERGELDGEAPAPPATLPRRAADLGGIG